MKDVNTMYPIGELAESASPSNKIDDERQELKKNQKRSLIKLGTMGILTLILVIFSTISWFTMNTQVESDGMSIKTGSMPYTIEFPGTDEGKYVSQYRTLTDQAGIWLVDNNKNMDNGSGTSEEELGLEPGDSGTLEFRLKPNGDTDTITVDICFTLRCIEKPANSINATSNQQLNVITDQELLGFVSSHIMLFTGIDANGKYTGLIQNNAQLQRYMRNKTYSKTDTGYTTLYWVWPLHLSNLISTQSSDLIYASGERSTVIQYMVAHKNGFFKDITTADNVLTSDLTAMNHYGSYSILFDKADLDIGNKVQYVILGLSVE